MGVLEGCAGDMFGTYQYRFLENLFHEIIWLKGHKVWLMHVCMQFDGYHNEPHHNWESSNLLCKHVN